MGPRWTVCRSSQVVSNRLAFTASIGFDSQKPSIIASFIRIVNSINSRYHLPSKVINQVTQLRVHDFEAPVQPCNLFAMSLT